MSTQVNVNYNSIHETFTRITHKAQLDYAQSHFLLLIVIIRYLKFLSLPHPSLTPN